MHLRDINVSLAKFHCPTSIARKAHDGIESVDSFARLKAEFGSAGADSIDGRPAFERYVHRPAHARSPLDAVSSWPAFKPIVEGRLQRWVREHDGCPDCVACHVLLRRYRAVVRRLLETHWRPSISAMSTN